MTKQAQTCPKHRTHAKASPLIPVKGRCKIFFLVVETVQRERFADPADYEACRGSYVVDSSLMEGAPAGTVVMHPLPRVDEISTDFDSDPRAAYFRQMENGMYVRMAILGLLLGEE